MEYTASYSEGLSLESFTVIIVQLLGLNMGLTYDTNTDKCLCAAEICTMMPKAVHFGGVKDFSTCSLDNFKYIIAHSNLNCLQNHSVETPVYKQPGKVCGNGKVEPGEECDCGTAKDCTHKSCCDPRTCMLKRKKVCGSGECCTKTCKIKPAGELCRERIDDQCDFPEYCNGSSSFCVEDTFARNGESCDSGDAWCFEGRCKSFDRQCQALIGGDSTGAPFDCYEEINSRGDRYGNCGPDVCAFPDLLCGKLICSWPHKRLVIRSNFSVLYTHLRDEMCVTTYRPFTPAAKLIGVSESTTYSGLADRDETFVHDGTPCGPGMVCNNFNHCHCEEDFAPPDCQVRKGEFGSIDDGHPIKPG
ncbi:disintegrin and metalloproteinase domain-containing protein 5-like [Tenrec ecaudatus]|uniref:disintegrin and metalloproteinase domain-containing protein 5-like n=1 Tax=Tenrec ecaudatus TaxID=94439 RepID=UPI003F5A24F1